MSYVVNCMILNQVKEKMIDILTVSQMDTLSFALMNVLTEYESTPIVVNASEKDIMLDAFVEAVRVEGRSEKTIDRYQYVIKRFLKAACVPSHMVTQYHIRKYLSDEKNRGISDSTIKGYCWVFSAYFGWLHRDGIIQKNPMGNIGSVKVQKKVKEVFTEVEIEKLKDACGTIRDKAIICFLKATGCRISEVTSLNRDNIDFVNLECVVLGKGNKQRTVYIDPVTSMILQNYLAKRTDDNPALFVGGKSPFERMNPGGIRAMLNRIGKIAGVNHVHPHKFRRTELTELVNRGMSIEQVKTLAGHEKIETTMGYVNVEQSNVKHSYRKFA